MGKKLTVLFLIIIIGNIFSCGSKQSISYSETTAIEPAEFIITPTRAERVMKALLEAYPDRIEKVEFRNDDWAVLLRGIWYYYAEGRLLPEDKKDKITEYRSLQFYHYPAELPAWTQPTPEEIARFRNWTANRRQSTVRRSSYFLDALWRASNRIETESRLVRITFLGRRTRVHYAIQENLALVETKILSLAETQSEVQAWINSLGTLEGWHWRNIADTQSRSYHSYGLAIDLLPRNLGRRQTYWLWTSQYREDWWNVTYNERYHPPATVVGAFETYGFIWGGKWQLFDTMHFEYRPEILVLNGLR